MAEIDALAQAAEAVERASREVEGASTDFAARVRTWFVQAWTSSFWSNYRKYAKEDMGFYTGDGDGSGQWSYEGSTQDLEKVKAEGRTHASMNHIQPVVDVLSGYERQNRYDLKTVPTGNEDAEDAQVMTLLLKHVQEQTESAALCSDVFEDTVIQGMSAAEVSIDWTRDPVYGDISLDQLEPGVDVLWDPNAKKLDLSDARYVLKFALSWVEDVVAQYPEHETAIREAADALDEAIREGKLSEWSPVDGYGGTQSHANETDELRGMFYDAAGEGRVMVIEAWYADYEWVWIVADKKIGSVTEVDSGEAAREMAAEDPDHLTAIRRRKHVIRSGTVLPGFYQTLEEDDTPYENDEDAYPIVPCFGKKKADQCYGIVRNLKDPQRLENKRESQLNDLVAKLANLRLVYEANSLENPATLKDPWSKEPIAVRAGHQGPQFLVPPLGEIVNVLRLTGDRNKMFIRESSGINTELLGLETDQSSGIAIARRQAQGQVISTGWFDHYRFFRKTLGKRLARRIQQVYTMDRTIRVIGPDGAATLIQINPSDMRDMEDDEFRKYREERQASTEVGPKILRNFSSLKYDVVISEVPTTPTARATSLLAILEILKVMPGLAPVLMEVAIELAEIPERQRVLTEIRALKAQATGGAPGAGPRVPESPTPPAGAQAPPTGASGLPTPQPTSSAI